MKVRRKNGKIGGWVAYMGIGCHLAWKWTMRLMAVGGRATETGLPDRYGLNL